MRIFTLTSAGALAGAALLFAASAAMAGHRPAAPDASGVIAGRQSAMLLSGALVGSMKGAIDRGDDVKGQMSAARSLEAWAEALPGLFPAGSDGGESEALPAVWSDRAGFEAKAAAFSAAAGKLTDAAEANDKSAFAAAWGEVRGTCGACHDSYKKKGAPH